MNVPFLDIKRQYKALADDISAAYKNIFESCSFIGGKVVQDFEKEIAEYIGVKHAIGCGNGTEALVLALQACGVGPGDEVITTPFSFFATAEAIAYVGAVPVFVDIKVSDYTIDPDEIEKAITERTKVILPVQIFGACADMDRILDIAKKHNLKVIEDDAQAIGSEYKGRKAGSLADIGCFSFYPTKNLGGCGDGGMCTTNDDDLAIILRSLREHGAGANGKTASDLLKGKKADTVAESDVSGLYNPQKYYNYLIGTNSRLDALQAAVLSIKLKHLEDYNKRRAEVAKRYSTELTVKVSVPLYFDYLKPCWHQYAILTERKQELCEYLSEHGVGNGMFYPVPLHRQKAFESVKCRISGDELLNADNVCNMSVCLPIFPEITDEEVDYVINTVNSFFEV